MKTVEKETLQQEAKFFVGMYALKVWCLCWKYIGFVGMLAIWKASELALSIYQFIKDLTLEKVFNEYLIGTLFLGGLLLWFIGSPIPKQSIKRVFQKR